MTYTLKHQTAKKISKGNFFTMGATVMPDGINFALFSQSAHEVYLLLFNNAEDDNPTDTIKLEYRTKYIWHVFVHGLKTGQLYGFKVKGDYNPSHGLRFNEHKLLIDPYAKALTGKFTNADNLLLGYNPFSAEKDLSKDTRPNDHVVPKCIAIDSKAFHWDNDVYPGIPLEESIIYEVHLKGFTAHPSAQVKHPGTYLGFIEKIPYLKQLGVNTVELLPVQELYTEDFLLEKGLTNYWGYNTIGFFAPESSYGTGAYPGCQVDEFKSLVKALHKEGMEIILDVVYNHTAEGNEMGPTLCFKGIDNTTYYSLAGIAHHPYRYYMNFTGCGNSVNFSNIQAIKFVMDSLRYWVEEMHVDGFRFDLASVLGRDGGYFHKCASFFDAVAQDPVLCRAKLIAEPWDLGTYEVGNFPIDWSEWNGRFRDSFRKFGKGDSGQLREIGQRITGSADLYADDGRSAYNSINFITCHDGFTLHDLVSYNHKHNEANLENNCDGTNDNNSWNCGAEGATDNPGVIALRKQLIKNYFCYLLFSLGTPMVLGGDEFMRSQHGNNNAYCQDNKISWFDWSGVVTNSDIVDFFKLASAFRKKHTILQRSKFYAGIDCDGDDLPDISWFGKDLNRPAWDDPDAKLVAFLLDGSEEKSDTGDYLLFIIFNSDFFSQYCKVPQVKDYVWKRVVDTGLTDSDSFMPDGKEIQLDPQDHYIANPRSVVVLKATR